jgi:ABC-type lipoprotein export system ATPase subunit
MILALLDTLHRERGCTIVMVTHDPAAAARAEMQLHLDKGLIAGLIAGPIVGETPHATAQKAHA